MPAQTIGMVFLFLCLLGVIIEVSVIFLLTRRRVGLSVEPSKPGDQVSPSGHPMTFTQFILVLGLVYLFGFLELQRAITEFNYFKSHHLDLLPDIRCLYCILPHFEPDDDAWLLGIIVFYGLLCLLVHIPAFIIMCTTSFFEDLEAFFLRQLPSNLFSGRYPIGLKVIIEEDNV